MIVAKLTLVTDAIGTTTTVLFCDGPGFTTGPSDTPAETECENRLLSAGEFTREMFAGQAVGGPVRAGFGVIELGNGDGRLDAWRTYGVDGQEIVLSYGDEGSAYPSGFTEIFRARMLRLDMSLRFVRVVLRDRLEEFDVPMCTETYGGSGGVDGTTTMAGRFKPTGYGHVFNANPVLVDPTNQIYQMGSAYESSTVDQYVRLNGEVQSNGAAYATLADLIATAPSAGQVRHYAAGGLFRLGSSTVYECTADRKFHDATGSVSSKIIENMALDAGADAGDITSPSAMGLTAGYYCAGDGTTFLQAMARIGEGAGLYFGWTRAGVFEIAQLTDPSGETPAFTFDRHNILAMERSTPPGFEVPAWRVRLNWRKNWRTMSGALSGTLSAADLDALRTEYFQTESADSAILDKHPRAITIERDSYGLNLATFTAPSTEATRVLNLFKEDRDLLVIEAAMSTDTLALDLGSFVEVQLARLGFDAGKVFVVVSLTINLRTRRMTFGLWG